MVFITNAADVTLTPPGHAELPSLLSAARSTGQKTFQQAANINRIYQGNGLICQTKMCQSLTGCHNLLTDCSSHPDWKQVLQFCGPVDTRGVAYDGAQWALQPADTHQQLLTATQQATGLPVLPTAYNVTGMY